MSLQNTFFFLEKLIKLDCLPKHKRVVYMNGKNKVDMILEIRSRILNHSNIKDVAVAEQLARQWVGNLDK